MLVNKYGRIAGTVQLDELAQMYAECDDDELKAHYRELAAESGVDLDAEPEEEEAEAEPEPEAEAEAEAEAEVEEAETEAEDGAPPKSGAGSGRDAWVAYAESLGVEVTDDMTRDEIVEAVEEEE